ncbi:ABC transporter substrate-binding protein [Gordonia hydrophobica]|uniref:ABC transporter substrate-binding protein n=1 Tax=Gordonia hydrophobica TaxID=40516 RepID=A0ABZ2U4M2_9ACTN|nr:ABC transporter substrate-binding protein [Gordonia hydrophobica]MBM7366882.1 iron complex transport system substrate-binding protein [Gordonia hydrophobica]
MFFKLPTSALRRTGALAATAALSVGLGACASDDGILRTPDGSVISTTVTRIAEVNIVNAGRDYAKTCLAPTAPDPGATDVTRIVVTDPALLDALCALGMGGQVKGIVAPAGSVPEFLGPQLTGIPALGDTPDAAAVTNAAPDVILSSPATANRLAALRDTGAVGAVRVVTVDPTTEWQTSFRAVAAAVHRSAAAQTRLTEFAAEATRVGRVMDAAQTQVSLVRFTPDAELIEGTSSFGAQVMAQVGVGRPATQRAPKAVPVTDANYTDADADLIYVAFQGPQGTERGKEVLLSDRWLDMGAPTWKRVLNVDDTVWFSGSGLAAAWLVLNDVKSSLNSSSSG